MKVVQSDVMKIQLLLFAQLRDLAGIGAMNIELEGMNTVNDLVAYVCSKFDQNSALVSVLNDKALMVSVNQKIAKRTDTLKNRDEVGFLPPVSGG